METVSKQLGFVCNERVPTAEFWGPVENTHLRDVPSEGPVGKGTYLPALTHHWVRAAVRGCSLPEQKGLLYIDSKDPGGWQLASAHWSCKADSVCYRDCDCLGPWPGPAHNKCSIRVKDEGSWYLLCCPEQGWVQHIRVQISLGPDGRAKVRV